MQRIQVSFSTLGGLIGGLAGAVLRPAVVWWSIGGQIDDDQALFVVLTSAAIGFIVGLLAGLAGQPLFSAIIGGTLATAALLLTYVPLLFCICLTQLERGGGAGELPSPWLVAFTGAVAGALGGLAERLAARRRQQAPQPGEVIGEDELDAPHGR